MEWYYVEAGQQAGPVSETQLNDLVATGKVQAGTLVWRPGLEKWTPHQLARGSVTSSTPTALAPEVGANQVVCTECKQIVSRDQALSYGAVWVCAICKPVFIQKIKEGAIEFSPTVIVYGGFWVRGLAKLIDTVIQAIFLMVPMILLMIFLMGSTLQNNGPTTFILLQVAYQAVGLVLGVTYTTIFLGKWGATPGKMVCGLRVIKTDGTPLTYQRAFSRAWAEFISSITLGVGYVIAAFDLEKRSLHDHICNTRVVKTR